MIAVLQVLPARHRSAFVPIEYGCGLLAIASLTLWFALGFPWQHHNESLVWAVEMQSLPFKDTLLSNPITPVQTWRPLGLALVWLGLRLTDGGIWLQQLLNYAITAAAWLLALQAVRARQAFAALAFVINAGFFSGYIYLFHLHGVFYGPLFLFLAWLIHEDARAPQLDRVQLARLILAAGVAALFHPFALLLVSAWIVGCLIDNRLRERPGSLGAAIIGILLAALATRLLVARSGDLGQADPLLGMLVSWRALELNPALALLSGVFALLAAAGAGHRRLWMLLTGALLLALAAFKLPLLPAWLLVAGLRALAAQRWTLAALIGCCAVLPAITATGSPTYALFALMPAAAATVLDLPPQFGLQRGLQQASLAVIVLGLALMLALRSGLPVPVISRLAAPLQAEREKTEQLQAVFAWLDRQPQLRGDLSLCEPGDFPIRSSTAIDRRWRAPTHTWPFETYLRARYGERLLSADGPALRLCFGDQRAASGTVLLELPASIAGAARLYRLPG